MTLGVIATAVHPSPPSSAFTGIHAWVAGDEGASGPRGLHPPLLPRGSLNARKERCNGS